MTFNRFIALGDSMTEGMQDEVVNGKYRGWADRVADVMAENYENFTYANLAIRGKLVGQVFEEQVPIALGLVNGPSTVVSFHAGANDALRPGYQSEIVTELYKKTVRKIAQSGATIMLFTVLEKTGNKGKGAEIWERRFSAFNRAVREVGSEVGAIVVDANQEHFLSDRRFLAFDRLHLNSIGHDRCAQAVQEKLGLPFDSAWRTPLPPAKKTPWVVEKAVTIAWFFVFAIPWIMRRIQGKSSGDGRDPKYATPTKWPIAH